jgi:TolA-binding protein
MKNKIIVSLVCVFSTAFFGSSAFAQTASPEPTQGSTPARTSRPNQEIREQREQERNVRATARAQQIEERKEEMCERVTERVKSVSARYQNKHLGAVKQYQTMKTRLQKIITDLKAKGANTTDLETAVAGLDTKITAVTSAHTALLESMESSKQYGCGNSDGALRESLETVKEKREALRASIAEARVYYQEEVRPEIIALRQQLASTIPSPVATTPASAN